MRDLRVRQSSLNSGATNVRTVTGIYSSMISADGRNLQLESGSYSSVLRWEKTTEVLCLLLEGQELRNAIRAQPGTRLWGYCDLSPDCRAIEQFGMGLEYAGISFPQLNMPSLPDEPPTLVGAGRLSGEAFRTHLGVPLGDDGCPIVQEWTRRLFAPMLEALGPKYASTNDCFMRTL